MARVLEETELLGAVDREWLAGWIAEQGPWIFHVAAASNMEAIQRDGLMPWDARADGTQFRGVPTPRRGYVYFCTEAWQVEHQWELSEIDARAGAVVCLDLRLIDPRRLVPDEDPWTLDVVKFDDDRWGLGSNVAQLLGPGGRWPTGGDWADAVSLGSQPGVVEWAFSKWGRVAVAGTLRPDTFAIARCDGHGRWSTPPVS
jgi:hypothetical protein